MTRYALGPQREPHGRLVVMDSFLVDHGRINHLDAHLARFATSAKELLGIEVPALPDELVPQDGRHFPRLETYEDGSVFWNVRPAPRLRTETTLWIPPVEDPRAHPAHKGPDHEMLGNLREQAVEHGCDDALLHSGGYVVEAANGAIIARDPSTGHFIVPPDDIPHLPSVTVGALKDVEKRALTVAELQTMDAFYANALHGITPITGYR